VASLSQGRTAAAQCGLFTHKSVPVIFEPPCRCMRNRIQGCGMDPSGPGYVKLGCCCYEQENESYRRRDIP